MTFTDYRSAVTQNASSNSLLLHPENGRVEGRSQLEDAPSFTDLGFDIHNKIFDDILCSSDVVSAVRLSSVCVDMRNVYKSIPLNVVKLLYDMTRGYHLMNAELRTHPSEMIRLYANEFHEKYDAFCARYPASNQVKRLGLMVRLGDSDLQSYAESQLKERILSSIHLSGGGVRELKALLSGERSQQLTDFLFELAEGHGNRKLKLAAYTALVEGERTEPVMMLVQRSLYSEDSAVREISLQGVGGAERSDWVVTQMVRATYDACPNIRKLAVTLLGEGEQTARIKKVLHESAIEDSCRDVRAEAIKAVMQGDSDDRELVDLLAYVIQRDRSSMVRMVAIEQLTSLEVCHREVARIMEWAKEDPNKRVRLLVERLLGS